MYVCMNVCTYLFLMRIEIVSPKWREREKSVYERYHCGLHLVWLHTPRESVQDIPERKVKGNQFSSPGLETGR